MNVNWKWVRDINLRDKILLKEGKDLHKEEDILCSWAERVEDLLLWRYSVPLRRRWVHFHDLEFGNTCLDMTSKTWAGKYKIDAMSFINLEIISASKGTIENEKVIKNGGNLLIMCMMRVRYPEYTKNIYNWTTKWLNSQLKNWKKSLNKYCTKEDTQMVNKYMRHAPYQQSLKEGKSKSQWNYTTLWPLVVGVNTLYRITFWGDEKFWNCIVIMVVQQGEGTWCHCILHIKIIKMINETFWLFCCCCLITTLCPTLQSRGL